MWDQPGLKANAAGRLKDPSGKFGVWNCNSHRHPLYAIVVKESGKRGKDFLSVRTLAFKGLPSIFFFFRRRGWLGFDVKNKIVTLVLCSEIVWPINLQSMCSDETGVTFFIPNYIYIYIYIYFFFFKWQGRELSHFNCQHNEISAASCWVTLDGTPEKDASHPMLNLYIESRK